MKKVSLCLMIFMIIDPVAAFSLSNDGRVAVLLYHSWNPMDHEALYNDLRIINAMGFKIIPLRWVAEFAIGEREGPTLPEKVIAISFDDGLNADWYDYSYLGRSFYNVLLDFQAIHREEQPYIHATAFVIASPKAREIMGGDMMTDEWWSLANDSGIMEIQNHSVDHENEAIHVSPGRGAWDSAIGVYITVGAGPRGGPGVGDFSVIKTHKECFYEVVKSAKYIKSKINAWPDLFAYPNGEYSDYIYQKYFPHYGPEHRTLAAFACGGSYVSRSVNRWLLPRFTFGSDWISSEGLVKILNDSQ